MMKKKAVALCVASLCVVVMISLPLIFAIPTMARPLPQLSTDLHIVKLRASAPHPGNTDPQTNQEHNNQPVER